MGVEPTISCLGSMRSTTELHPHVDGRDYSDPLDGCQAKALSMDENHASSLTRLLFPFKKFVCQLKQRLASLALRVSLTQIQERQIGHLFRGFIG